MKDNILKNNAIILSLITFLFLSFTACRTKQVTALEYYQKDLSVDISNHDLVYTYPNVSQFEGGNLEGIDAFDRVFLEDLTQSLIQKKYLLEKPVALQTITLDNCITSIEPSKIKNDSVYRALMACRMQGVNKNLFYAEANIAKTKTFISDYEMELLGRKLANASSAKIDSIQIQTLRKKDPEKYTANYEEKELYPAFRNVLLGLIIITIAVLSSGGE